MESMELGMNGAELRARKNLHWQREKQGKILDALSCDPIDLKELRTLSVSMGGLVHTSIRKKAWPKLAGINVFYIDPYQGPSLMAHKDRAQVLLDVNRCGKRIPPHFSESRRKAVQDQLTRVILRLLAENEELHYYQGLHDIVITFLLVAGEDIAYAIMSKLAKYHIRDFLDVDMNRTKLVIGYLQPLIALEDPRLEQFITRSDCAYYFSLSWLITWYGHVVKSHDDACRLVDVFLATHPLMPVYMAAAIVLSKKSEVLEVECEMSAVHGLLSKLPQNLSYEQMIVLGERLFEKYPPSTVAKKGRFKLNQNTLVSSYSHFLTLTANQRPDHILRQLPPPKKKFSFWAWLTNRPGVTFLSILPVAGPVLLAVLLYWLFGVLYNRTSILDSDSIGFTTS